MLKCLYLVSPFDEGGLGCSPATICSIDPNDAKVEDATDSRRRGCSRRNLLQTLDNAEDVVSSAFPACHAEVLRRREGKQHGVF